MTRILAVSCLAVAIGSVSAWSEEAPAEAIPSAEEILANPLEDAAYVKNVRCLSTARYRQVDIVDSKVLVFRGRGNRAWINMLLRPCAGLRRDMILTIERRGSRICRRDFFKGVPRLGREAGTATCALGMFYPVAQDNLDALRHALSDRNRNRAVARTVRSDDAAAGEQ